MRKQKTSYIIVAGIILFSFHAVPFVSPQNASRPEMQGTYFTETGCNHCDSFLYIQKPRLEEIYGIHIALETHDILSTKGYELCVEMLEQRGLKFTVFPVLFIGSNVYRGSNAIEENMPKEIEYFLSHGSYMPTIRQTDQSALAAKNSNAAFAASALPTIFAGLLDGINPCAFSTMLFFLSFMALKRKDQRSLLWVGLAFIVSVFIAYFLIGLGLLGALRKYLSENRFSKYINIFISAIAAIFAVLNVRDAIVASRGRAFDSVLQMPTFFKQLNHRFIRYFNQLPLYILGAAISGFLVSFIELACTGQIYLPTLAYMNQSMRSSKSILLLLMYNLAFILPLSLVFVLFFFGLRHEKIRQWYGSHLALVRLLSAVFFVALAVLVWAS